MIIIWKRRNFLNERYPKNGRFMASLEYVLNIASTVRLRAGPWSLTFGAGGGIALSGVAFSHFQAYWQAWIQLGDRCDSRKKPWILD